jgi:hypothetical protein
MILTSASSLGLAILTPVFVSNQDWLDWMTAFTITFWIGIVSIPLTVLIIKDRHEETNADRTGTLEGSDRAETATVTERPSPKWNLSIYKEMIGKHGYRRDASDGYSSACSCRIRHVRFLPKPTCLIFHQAGAVLGSLSGGFFFDLTNSY